MTINDLITLKIYYLVIFIFYALFHTQCFVLHSHSLLLTARGLSEESCFAYKRKGEDKARICFR